MYLLDMELEEQDLFHHNSDLLGMELGRWFLAQCTGSPWDSYGTSSDPPSCYKYLVHNLSLCKQPQD
jgi:hypothetical protein